MKTSYFPQYSPINDPLDPPLRWIRLEKPMNWFLKDLSHCHIISYHKALSRSIAFKHWIRSISFGYVGENVIFSSIQPPKWPPDPLQRGVKFQKSMKYFEGIYSNALSRSIAFKYRFRSKIFGYIGENVIYSSNQPPKWPLFPPAERSQLPKIDEMTWKGSIIMP